MTMKVAELIEHAKQLSPEDRAELLDGVAAIDEPEFTPQQLAEWHRRADEMRNDPSIGIPAEQVFAELEREFGPKK